MGKAVTFGIFFLLSLTALADTKKFEILFVKSPCDVFLDETNRALYVTTNDGQILEFQDFKRLVQKWGPPKKPFRCGAVSSILSGIIADRSGVYTVDIGNKKILKLGLDLKNGREMKSGLFKVPVGISQDPKGFIYVSDFVSGRVLRVDEKSGQKVFIDSCRKFKYPSGFKKMQWSGDGFLYVIDSPNSRVLKFDAEGKFICSWGGHGSNEGQFDDLDGLVVNQNKYVYVSDSGNNRIQKFTSDGKFISKIESFGDEKEKFTHPLGLAVDKDGFLYVADFGNDRIVKMKCP